MKRLAQNHLGLIEPPIGRILCIAARAAASPPKRQIPNRIRVLTAVEYPRSLQMPKPHSQKFKDEPPPGSSGFVLRPAACSSERARPRLLDMSLNGRETSQVDEAGSPNSRLRLVCLQLERPSHPLYLQARCGHAKLAGSSERDGTRQN